MVRRFLFLVVVMAGLGTITGCAGYTLCAWTDTNLDRNWGRSYESAKHNQILDPQASKNLEPVEGLEGPAAAAVLGNYRKSFEPEEGEKSYTLNLGSIDKIGGSSCPSK